MVRLATLSKYNKIPKHGEETFNILYNICAERFPEKSPIFLYRKCTVYILYTNHVYVCVGIFQAYSSLFLTLDPYHAQPKIKAW